MKLKTTITAEGGKEAEFFNYFRVSMVDAGVRIEARSPLFGNWVKSISFEGVEDNIKFYRLPTTGPWYDKPKAYRHLTRPFPMDELSVQVGFIAPDNSSFFSNGAPNLLWLAHVDLAEGMDLVVKQPISLNDLQDYFNSCAAAIREIYAKMLRRATFEATFSEIWEKEEAKAA